MIIRHSREVRRDCVREGDGSLLLSTPIPISLLERGTCGSAVATASPSSLAAFTFGHRSRPPKTLILYICDYSAWDGALLAAGSQQRQQLVRVLALQRSRCRPIDPTWQLRRLHVKQQQHRHGRVQRPIYRHTLGPRLLRSATILRRLHDMVTRLKFPA